LIEYLADATAPHDSNEIHRNLEAERQREEEVGSGGRHNSSIVAVCPFIRIEK
jgi:hypothetical protein